VNISRKEFFRKSLTSLGEAICTVSDALKAPVAPPQDVRETENFTATPSEDLVAAAHNDRCLAKNSGCFSCMERCEFGAIKLIPGVGVRINQQLCTGCGACEHVCPVTPKAIRMQARTIHTPSADHAEQLTKKGISTC